MAVQRLFLGVPLSHTDCEAIHNWRVKQTVREGIKWVKDEHLHLTLYFFGNLEVETTPNLIQLITLGLKNCKPFQLSLDKVVFAPRVKEPRMIWLRYQKHPAFRQLVNQIGDLYRQIDPDQQFRKSPIPHVTVARMKKNCHWQSISLDIPGLSASFPVKQMTLWESKLFPSGPVYEVVHQFKLG